MKPSKPELRALMAVAQWLQIVQPLRQQQALRSYPGRQQQANAVS